MIASVNSARQVAPHLPIVEHHPVNAVIPSSAPSNEGQARPSLRVALRDATGGSHHRMHLHAAFFSIQTGRIKLPDYRALLVRLAGFYLPFEASVGEAPERSRRLAADLRDLGVSAAGYDALPRCPYVPDAEHPMRRLGALYVAEGAALGGRHLARCLDSLFGPGTVEGRRFFLGRGAATGRAWQSYLARLETFASHRAARGAIIGAACETFAAFERWLEGWQAPA